MVDASGLHPLHVGNMWMLDFEEVHCLEEGTRGCCISVPLYKAVPDICSSCALVSCLLQRMQDGRRYYDFEFTAKTRNYTRRALASVTVGNGEAG